MADYAKPIGNGGIWIKEGKKGKYLSWTMTFPVNGSVPIQVDGVAFKNEKKEGNQPDYKMIVNGWKHPKAKKVETPDPPLEKANAQDEDGIPF